MRTRATLLGLLVLGCAPAAPVLAGGRTTPRDRSDIALGAAVRVPVTDLIPSVDSDARELTSFAAPGGAAPVASVRHGLSGDVDLGVEAIGSYARLTLRGQLGSGLLHVMAALSPEAGVVYSDPREGTQGGTAFRVGGSIPLLLAIDVSSLYELWLGPRVGLAYVGGDSAGRSIALSGLRAGGVIGLAVGFRRLHLLVELAVDYELWWGSLGAAAVERSGLVLTPAFAIRLRL